MIADAARDNCNNELDMASTSDSKILDGPKGEEKELRRPDSNPEPASTNGDVAHEKRSPKEEDDGHVTSEDEDKLVINEICEKKDVPKPEGYVRIPAEPLPSGSLKETREPSPKSPLKRSADESDNTENVSKKQRMIEELPDQNELTPDHLEESMALLKSDLQGIQILLAQKEEEWNSLLRLQKRKEELYSRLFRKRQIMGIKKEDTKEEESAEEEEDEFSFLPQQLRSSLNSSQLPLMMMKHMLGESYMPHVSTSSRASGHSKDSSSTNGPLSSHNTISVIDIHTSNSKPSGGGLDSPQVSISPEAHSKLGRHLNSMISMKPILPKSINCIGGLTTSGGVPTPLSYPPTGYGPQGPTVSVHHLIAAHRKDNPNVPPIRGAKRGAWRHRYEGDKRGSPREHDRPSSVSSSMSEDARLTAALSHFNHKAMMAANSIHNNNSLLAMNDPSVSYKDVLLQFAQLTQQSEKQPGSPQISIIPVSGDTPSRKFEHIPDSTSVSREISLPSQSSSTQPPNLVALLGPAS